MSTLLSFCARTQILRIPLQLICNFTHRMLAIRINNVSFPNPIGLTSGDPKHRLARAAPSLGFGFGQISTHVRKYSAILYRLPQRYIPLGTHIKVNIELKRQLVLARLADFAILEGSQTDIKKSLKVLRKTVKIIFIDATEHDLAKIALLAKKERVGLFIATANLKELSTAYKLSGGAPILNAYEIHTAQDAYNRILHGAQLLQIGKELIDEGPRIAYDINSGLVKLLYKDGYQSLQEAVGKGI